MFGQWMSCRYESEYFTFVIAVSSALSASFRTTGTYCQRALLLYGDGRWCEGPVDEVLTAPALSELYSHPMRIIQDGDTRHIITL